MPHANMPREILQCIEACASCHQACVDAASYCLEMGGAHAAADHVRTMLDCEQICHTTGDFMLRTSAQHAITCEGCAKVCDACAESCEQFQGNAVMMACAQACRICAEACRRAAPVPMPARLAQGSP